jgi:trimethylamine:corrinoid methyltransferase-like protein
MGLFYFWYLGAEQTFQKFLDLCRHTEAFFLNKRLILSKQKPEQAIKDVSYFYTRLLECKKMWIKYFSAPFPGQIQASSRGNYINIVLIFS